MNLLVYYSKLIGGEPSGWKLTFSCQLTDEQKFNGNRENTAET
jgi:hypothetical protein